MSNYIYQEFPRIVYGPDDATAVINSEDERPDGDVAAKTASRSAAKAEKAEKKLRAGYREFLDAHGVEYAADLPTEQLAELAKQLEEHLTAPAGGDDNGE